MKKIITLLVIVTLIAAGAPGTFAAEGPKVTLPEEGDIQKDPPPIKKTSAYKEGFDTTGAAVFGASLLGLIAIMASSDDGTGHTGHSGHSGHN